MRVGDGMRKSPRFAFGDDDELDFREEGDGGEEEEGLSQLISGLKDRLLKEKEEQNDE